MNKHVPKMAKMRLNRIKMKRKIAKMTPKIAKMRLQKAKMRPKMAAGVTGTTAFFSRPK